MIPAPAGPPGPAWEAARDRDPVVQRYRAFFALLDWDGGARARPAPPLARAAAPPGGGLRQGAAGQALRGQAVRHRPAHLPRRAPAAGAGAGVPAGPRPGPALRLRRRADRARRPLAAPPAADPRPGGPRRAPAPAPCGRWRPTIPDLGTTVAVDVKHIYAWVRENNPKETSPTASTRPANRGATPTAAWASSAAPTRPAATEKEYLWGYGTGIVSATDPVHGDVVLAEVTQPFNRQDVTYFHPVYARPWPPRPPPTNLAADAAFDAWHVYQTCAAHGGLAAIPRNRRGPAPPPRRRRPPASATGA